MELMSQVERAYMKGRQDAINDLRRDLPEKLSGAVEAIVEQAEKYNVTASVEERFDTTHSVIIRIEFKERPREMGWREE